MKALVKTAKGVGNVELLDVPEPMPIAGEVKIEVGFAGVCGTDLHIYHDCYPYNAPVILGHEISGTVVELGEGVRDVAVGDRVCVLPSVAVICGKCRFCRSGNYVFCEQRRGMGHGVDGGFRKYCCVREEMAYRLPDPVSMEVGALAETVACGAHAVIEVSGASALESVLISGPGSMGLICLRIAKLSGARVMITGVSSDSERLAVAKALGADKVVNIDASDLSREVREFTSGHGVDISIECSGNPHAAAGCVRSTRKLGTVVLVGIPASLVSLPVDVIVCNGLKLLGSMGHTWQTWDKTVELMKSAKTDFGRLITHKLPLSDWKEAFDLMEKGLAIKALLCPE